MLSLPCPSGPLSVPLVLCISLWSFVSDFCLLVCVSLVLLCLYPLVLSQFVYACMAFSLSVCVCMVHGLFVYVSKRLSGPLFVCVCHATYQLSLFLSADIHITRYH